MLIYFYLVNRRKATPPFKSIAGLLVESYGNLWNLWNLWGQTELTRVFRTV